MVVIKTGRDGFLENLGCAETAREAKTWLYENHYHQENDNSYVDKDGFQAEIEHVLSIWDVGNE